MRGCSFLSKLAVEVVTESKKQCFSLAVESEAQHLQASAVCSYVKPPTEVSETLLCLLSHTFLLVKGLAACLHSPSLPPRRRCKNADGGQSDYM